MKVAVIAITKHGVEIGKKIKGGYKDGEVELFVSEKHRVEDAKTFGTIKEITPQVWNYDGIIYIVSLGAVVRTIAPYIKDKKEDPAVLVIDDAGRFVISVLSGHLGRANELAEKIAKIISATPVITTASDSIGTIPVDILGREFGWEIENWENITSVSADVVNGERIAVVQETGEKNWWKREKPLPPNIHIFYSLSDVPSGFKSFLIITDRIGEFPKRSVIYRPKSLVLGIGTDRGITADSIEKFVFRVLEENKLSFKSVRNIATSIRRMDEEGLLEFAKKYNLKIEFFEDDELNSVKDLIPNPSPYSQKYFGVVGVAEPSALLSAKTTKLLVPKVKGDMITLAIARVNFD